MDFKNFFIFFKNFFKFFFEKIYRRLCKSLLIYQLWAAFFAKVLSLNVKLQFYYTTKARTSRIFFDKNFSAVYNDPDE